MTNLRSFCTTSTTQVFLRIDNQSFSTSQTLLEHWIPGRQWHSVVSTFNDEVDLRQHSVHLGQSSSVMTQEV